MTALSVAGEARQRVDRIKTGVEVVWSLIVESYQSRDWEALGYATWDEMCTREFGTSRLRLPREERSETIGSLRDAGLSLRAIAAATGDSVTTVRRELAPVPNGTPDPEPVVIEETAETSDEIDARLGPIGYEIDHETGEIHEPDGWDTADVVKDLAGPEPITPAEKHATVTGLDGKRYAPSRPAQSKRKPLPDAALSAGFELRKAMERIERIVSDDRFRTNEKQVSNALRGHLLYVAETVAAVIDQLPKSGA
jgi:hypothetical protein